MPKQALGSGDLPNPQNMSDQEVLLLHHLVKHRQAEVPPAEFIVQLATPLRNKDAREAIAYLALFLPSLQTSVAAALYAWTLSTTDPMPEDISTTVRSYLYELLRVGNDVTAAYALALLYLAIQQRHMTKRLKPEHKHRFAPSVPSEPRDVRIFAARVATMFSRVDRDRLRFFIQYLPKLPTMPVTFRKNQHTRDVMTWLDTHKKECAATSTYTAFTQFQTDERTDNAFATLPTGRTASEYSTWLVGLVIRDAPFPLPLITTLALTLARKQHIVGIDAPITSVAGVQSTDIDKTLFIPMLNWWNKLHPTTLEILYRLIDRMTDTTLAVVAGLYATYLFLSHREFAMAKAMDKQVSQWYESLPEVERDRVLAFLQQPEYASTTHPDLLQVLSFLGSDE